MAVPAGTIQSYNEPIATGGNREDLSDVLFDVSPTETPFLTAIGKNTATATNHEWLTDALADPVENAAVEGDDAAGVTPSSRVRLNNYTQILTKEAIVSGTQEKVLKGGGIKSEMAYQVARRMKEIKRDLEQACVGTPHIKEAGSDTTPRFLGSLETYLSGTSYQGGVGAASPTGNGVNLGTPGTPRPFDEAILIAALAQLWDQSGGNENVLGLAGSFNRGIVSTFTASSTRYVSTDDAKLQASIDVYDGDFHTVTMTPDRYTAPDSVFIIDPEFAKLSDQRPMFSQDLAVTGDSTKKQVIWETTLEVCNPLAIMQIAGLTVA
tara:strand:- start:1558 stop:2526 length:969 start_codon:yes stop_codon:yes gene_type:complete